jgi:hypothetical protein
MLVTSLLAYACIRLNLDYLFINEEQIQLFFVFHLGFVSLLGSLFPDFDYRKTKIRHMLGPALGGFIVISYIYLNRNAPTEIDPILILFLMFIFIVIPFLFGIAVPFKHHGKLHTIVVAIIFAILWIVIELLVFDLSKLQAILIGFFGFINYSSHLLIDRNLKWF